jgi:Leucine-rich repeat (LRR) protein
MRYPLCLALLLATCALPAGAAAPGKADVEALKRWLALANTFPTGKEAREDFRRRLDSAANAISDADLRKKARDLTPELEKSAELSSRIRKILKDISVYGGSGKTEPGGPEWLRKLVGDEPMQVFARLTELSAVDRSLPIKSGRRNTKVTDEWLKNLAGLPDLKKLDIHAADVHGTGLDHIATLETLQSLNLTLLPINDEPLRRIAGLKNLRALLLASTKVTGTCCRHFTGMTKLANLNFHSAPISDDGLEQIGKLASLERLEIVHTGFTDKGAKHLAGLKNLKRLQLGSRGGTGKALASLSSLKNLQELDVYDGQATQEGIDRIAHLASLRVLRMSGGALASASFKPLGGLDKLESIVLIHNQATDASVKTLSACKALRKLAIEEPKVTPACLGELRRALPKLMIVKP